ncbi:GntR family transcriptional regulator [Cypionkella aquatica]|uniref:GntR family transcriptional regulator n=1 Tax=Cypionkella aquatica TaxID=1756042 RepID=A0AA37TWW6_9RHOB|nr:GntR family transcriptional regulator [Cypionkella aquatica]GLS87383.1 GntR family transcriptional regulator [Cypionkella aquatica]GLS88569.1 GntR family transcriptional regulator [Cypionkella aquatica]
MTKTDQAIDQLQRMIEHGDLKPGSMVSESQLVEIMGLGRTPIREAIQRLASSRMIRVHPSKGLEIPAISVEDQLSALELRRPIEVLSVELASARATVSQRAAMQDLAGVLDGPFALREYTDTVRKTHAMIIDASQNPYLSAAMLPLQALSRRFWITYIRDEADEIRRGGALHRQMLLAVAAGNADAARAASLALNDYLVAYALAVIARRTAPHSGG